MKSRKKGLKMPEIEIKIINKAQSKISYLTKDKR
jgi:hypothetical protein